MNCRIAAVPFTLRNITEDLEDLEDLGSNFDGSPDLEFRHASKTLEEVYVVMRGSGRMKLDDRVVEVKEWDVVRVSPGTWRGYEGGPEGLEILSSVRPVSARIRAKTWRVSASSPRGSLPSNVIPYQPPLDRAYLRERPLERPPVRVALATGSAGALGGPIATKLPFESGTRRLLETVRFAAELTAGTISDVMPPRRARR